MKNAVDPRQIFRDPTRAQGSIPKLSQGDRRNEDEAVSKGLAPRRGKAFREIFQIVRDHLEQEEHG